MVENGAAGTSDSYTSSRFPKSSIRTRRPPATRGEAAFTALAPDPTTSTSAWTLPSRGMLGRPSQRSAAAALRDCGDLAAVSGARPRHQQLVQDVDGAEPRLSLGPGVFRVADDRGNLRVREPGFPDLLQQLGGMRHAILRDAQRRSDLRTKSA